MKKSTICMLAALLLVIPLAHTALAQKDDVVDTMSWLDGFSLIVLEGDDISGLHRARTEIQSHGGRVAILSPPSLILGWIPYDARPGLIGRAGIKEIYYTPVHPEEVALDDSQSRYMLEYYNSVVRGDYQREFMSRSSASRTQSWPAGQSDALQRPPLEEDAYIDNLEKAGLDIGKLRDRGILLSEAGVAGNSDAMTGLISLTLFFVESDGSIDPDAYTWTEAHVQEYIDGVNTGLAWWTQQAYLYFDCWNAFLVRYFPPTDPRCQQGYEPVNHTSSFHSTWAGTVINQFGYGGSVWTATDAYNTFQRSTYGTDWAFSAYVAYNPSPAPDQFTNGTSAFAYLGGPHTVLLYRSYSWAPQQVFTHETGHIFFACDEYDGSGCSCTCGGLPHTNCYLCASFPCMMKSNSFALCSWTPAQVGWQGTGCAPTPLVPPVPSGFTPPSALQGLRTTVTLSGSGFVWGADIDLGPDITVHEATVINSSTIEVDMTPATNGAIGLVDLVVTNRDLQVGSLSDAFEVLPTRNHYASPSGNNVFPYLTPADAATSLADVLAAAADGDTVLVETGTYNPIDFLDISRGFTLLGAWNGSFTTRDVVSGKSTIDLTHPLARTIRVQPKGAAVQIDGFIIHGGDGSFQPTPISGDYGGCVFIDSAYATVSNCVLTASEAGSGGNYGAGGAIYARRSIVDIRDNEITNNTAGQGGAIFLEDCSGSLTNNTVSSNSVTFNTEPSQGGGIHIANCSSLALIDNMVSNNSSSVGVSGNHHGGGIFVTASTGVTVSGGGIVDNDAQDYGGGLYYETSDVALDGVLLTGNGANFGGAVGTPFGGTATVSITDCELSWNTATLIGGGAMLAGTATVEHSLFVGNHANSFAGACYFSSVATGSFVGNTVDRNTATTIGGVYLTESPIPVFNNIIVNSADVGLSCLGTLPSTSYNNVWNSTTSDYSGCTPGIGSVSADPLFADTASTDYRLAINSPAIDAGDPDPAYDDPDGSRGDMGRYGSHAFVMDQPAYVINLAATAVGGDVMLQWSPSPEPDVEWFAIYKDTIDGFTPSTTNFLQLAASPAGWVNVGAIGDTCYYRVNAIDTSGYAGGYSAAARVNTITGVGESVSYGFELYQNHPNPFNPTTRIRYDLSESARVVLAIFDVQGRVVRRLVDTVGEPGVHAAEWDGRDTAGNLVSSGIYFYRLQAGTNVQTRKMVLLK